MTDLKKEIIERNKNLWFVQHIEKHLKDERIHGKVLCKICNKDIDTIANERMEELIKMINKESQKSTEKKV